MGIAAMITAVLSLAGIVIRPDTAALIERSVSGITKVVSAMIKGKKEPSPSEVASMMAALDAGSSQWDSIIDDWK